MSTTIPATPSSTPRLQGGTAIDLFFTYSVPRLGQRIKAGAALDLTAYIDADADIKAWVDGTEGIFSADGTITQPADDPGTELRADQQGLMEEAGAALPVQAGLLTTLWPWPSN